MLALAGTINDATHNGDVQAFNTGIFCFPRGHFSRKPCLDILRQVLEHGGCRAPTSGTCGNLRHESAKAHGLQQFLAGLDLKRTVPAGFRRQRVTDGIPDAFLQQNTNGSRCRHQTLGTHSRFGQAQMQRVVGAGGQHAVTRNQILHR